MERVRVKIERGKKGDLIGSPFCLIDRRSLALVKEGEEWECEVVRTITDRRGRAVKIVRPVKPVLRVEGGQVYCGSHLLGEPQTSTEVREYDFGVELITRFLWNGEEVGRESRLWTLSDLEEEEDIPPQVLPLLLKRKEEQERMLLERLEKERPSPEKEREMKEWALRRREEILRFWEELDVDALPGEAEKAEEERERKIKEALEEVRRLYPWEGEGEPELKVHEETLKRDEGYGWTERIYKRIYRILVRRPEPVDYSLMGNPIYTEPVGEEWEVVRHTTTTYEGDQEGPVYVGVGVDRDVIHSEEVLETSEGRDRLLKAMKLWEKAKKDYRIAKELQEKAKNRLLQELEEIRRIKENIREEVKVYEIGGYYWVEYPSIERVAGIATLKRRAKDIPPWGELFPDFQWGDFLDLPLAIQMIEEGEKKYAKLLTNEQ